MENFCSCPGSVTRDNERTGEDDNDNALFATFITDTIGKRTQMPAKQMYSYYTTRTCESKLSVIDSFSYCKGIHETV